MPPCPGIIYPKSLTYNALLNPEAKKPPKGPIKDANRLKIRECFWKSERKNSLTPTI